MQLDEVAKAIWSEDRCANHRCNRKAWGWENLDARRQEVYRRMAQAAIEALNPANAG